MSRRQPFLGRRQCETKTSASGTELYKIIIQLHPQCRILRKAKPLAQLMKSRVCHEFACPIVPWVSPCSCTRRIPKQNSFNPPVRRQIRHMHRKFPVMFEALFQTKGSIHVVARVLLPCHSNDAESHAKVRFHSTKTLAARGSCVTFCEKQRPTYTSHSSGLFDGQKQKGQPV